MYTNHVGAAKASRCHFREKF